MNLQMIRDQILPYYTFEEAVEIQLIPSTNPVYKLITKGGSYILKDKGNVSKMKIHETLQKHLESQGIKIPKIKHSKAGETFLTYQGGCYFITEYIEGEPLSNAYNDLHPEAFSVYGEIMGKLHLSLKDISYTNEVSDTDVYYNVYKWAFDGIHQAGHTDELIMQLKAIMDEELKLKTKDLPYQFIHRDFHPGNVLFHEGQFSGIIDFDIAVKDLRVFDLAYFLAGQLVCRYDTKEKYAYWINIVKDFCVAYHNINPLSEREKEALWILMMVAELYFMVWFIEQKDDVNRILTGKVMKVLMEKREQIESIVRECI